MSAYASAVGRTRVTEDVLDPWRANALAALIGREPKFAAGSPLPILWDWIYFHPVVSVAQTGPDGHPRRGDFLPAVTLQRRMFAGGKSAILKPLVLGRPARRHERISDVAEKTGQAGPMVLVTVSNTIEQDGVECVREQQSVFYLDGPPSVPSGGEKIAIPPADWGYEMAPERPMLFRYSALTYNGHRIHYDADYARSVEGYPDIVVHGPLTATMLADLAERSAGTLKRFSFRAKSPLFVGRTVSLRGRREGDNLKLTAYDADGREAMAAEAGTSADA